MKKLKFFITNAGLAYRKYAILMQCKDDKYLVVESNSTDYELGSYKTGFTDFELNETKYDIKDSKLYNNLIIELLSN